MRPAASRQTSRKPSWFVRLVASHTQSALFALGNMRQALFANGMTISVIAIALALPTIFLMLLLNIKSVGNIWEHGTQISLFLHTETTETNAKDLLEKIKQRNDVLDVKYVSPAQGLEDLDRAGGFGDVLDQLPNNPLPPVLEVYPEPAHYMSSRLETLIHDLNKYREVETSKLDMQWLMRLSHMIAVAQRLAFSLVCLLSLAVLLVVGNTIRLATHNRRREIEVFKLIGATDSFVRRPFLYSGLFYGLFGAGLAWILLIILQLGLNGPIERLAKLYGSDFRLIGLSFEQGLILLGLGTLLGVIGAWVAVNRQIVKIDP